MMQIAPLTEEEKKHKLEELKAKLAEKRANKAVEESKEHKANEAIRRKGGKVCQSSTQKNCIATIQNVVLGLK